MANLRFYRRVEHLAQMLIELHRDGYIDPHDDKANSLMLRADLMFNGKCWRPSTFEDVQFVQK